MKEIKAYQCDFCSKYYNYKSNAKRHESECFHNPDTRSCIACENYDNSKSYTSSDDLPVCKVGIKFEILENGKIKLRTHCKKWEERVTELY